jgi:AcrR family transcriptional regulator
MVQPRPRRRTLARAFRPAAATHSSHPARIKRTIKCSSVVMTYPPYLREKARQLRAEKELTIDEIAERLAVSRTSVFYWVGDMPRPARCVRRRGPAHQLGSRAMQQRYKRIREEAHELGLWEFPRLCREPGFRDFVCMYIGEGFKRNRNTVALANSDPAVIRLADRWLREFSNRKIGYGVQHHADQDLDELRRFWGTSLGVDPRRIQFQRKSNSSQLKTRTWRSQHGVLTVRTNDTYFRARLEGWMTRLKDLWLE